MVGEADVGRGMHVMGNRIEIAILIMSVLTFAMVVMTYLRVA